MKEQKLSLFPLLWIMFFDHTCLNITFPILTLLFFDTQSSLFSAETDMATRSMWYGLCVAIPHFVNMIAAPILSTLSDTVGRKKILLLSTLGAFLFAAIAGAGVLGGFISLLFLGRIIQGVFSRTNPIAQAVIGDISSPANKVLSMGYLQTAISLGAFLGPVMGGYFANRFFFSHFNFSLPYFIAMIFGLISFILTLIFFKETLRGKSHADFEGLQLKRIQTLFLNKKVRQISLLLLLVQISWSLYYQFIPPLIKTELQFTSHQLGLFVGLVALWLALATSFGIRVLYRFFSPSQMLLGSLYVVLIGIVLSALFCFLPLKGPFIWFASIPTAVGDAIAFSCLTALYSNAVNEKDQGKVMGVCFVVIALVWSLTGLIGGFLMRFYPLLPLIIAPIGALLAIVVLSYPKWQTVSDIQARIMTV